MSEENTILKALEHAFQQNENEVVIELGPDRMLQFIGVRLIIILAIAVKLTEIVVGNLTCHPVNNETGYTPDFIKFSETYCWESPVITSEYINPNSALKKACYAESHVKDWKLLENPMATINVMRWMPYVLLFQAFLFALPSAWWHLRVGGRLMGHLKFMKLFIQRIYEQLKDLPAGIYDEKISYDGSCHVSGWSDYKHHQDNDEFRKKIDPARMEEHVTNTLGMVRGESLGLHNDRNIRSKLSAKSVSATTPSHSGQNGSDATDSDDGSSEGVSLVQSSRNRKEKTGKMLDRHLFSILCYENFSSLEQHPYLLSIFRLTYCAKFDDEEGIFPMDQSILRQWCHEKNFSGRFLVVRYYLKHVFGIILSLATLRVMALIFEILGGDVWHSESFSCDVIYYEEVFIVCTLHRKTEMLAFLITDFIVILLYLVITVVHLYFISRSRDRGTCSFFEYINDLGSIAMLAALREKQDEERKKK